MAKALSNLEAFQEAAEKGDWQGRVWTFIQKYNYEPSSEYGIYCFTCGIAREKGQPCPKCPR